PPPPPLRTGGAPFQCIRLKHRTPPLRVTRRGRPIGLGVDLDSTTAEPATDDRRRPHLRTLPSETDLLCLPNRFTVDSCPPTPQGSPPASAGGDVPPPIRPVTGRPSLPPPSVTRRPVGSPCGRPTLAGGRRAYHVASQEPSWVRPRLDAGGAS